MALLSKLGPLATGMSLAGSYLNYKSFKAEARATELTAIFNASENRKRADQIMEQAAEDQKRFRLAFRKDQASNEVSVAKAGVRLDGSALEVLRENARLAEEDAERIRKSADIEATQLRKQAILFDGQAASARRAGKIGSAAILLGGAAQSYGVARQSGVV